jgi:non-heme chloroperoxidase
MVIDALISIYGFGDSDKPWDGYNYDTMANDVNAVLNALSIENAILVGFSIGGAISIHYRARHIYKNLLFWERPPTN